MIPLGGKQHGVYVRHDYYIPAKFTSPREGGDRNPGPTSAASPVPRALNSEKHPGLVESEREGRTQTLPFRLSDLPTWLCGSGQVSDPLWASVPWPIKHRH